MSLQVVQTILREYIAYKQHDSEGDVWSERAFLFEDRESVRKFFSPNNEFLKKLYCEEERYDPITDFEVFDDNPARHITMIIFKTIYAGEVKIMEMHDGYLIPK